MALSTTSSAASNDLTAPASSQVYSTEWPSVVRQAAERNMGPSTPRMPVPATTSAQPGRGKDMSTKVVTPDNSISDTATWLAYCAVSMPMRKTGMYSYSELWPSLSLPSASSKPRLPGSDDGWVCTLPRPGMAIRPLPGTTLSAGPA
ncbi:hypothetical protein G6F59_017440 [Rhizopus arrhizus]|nr:hypothetical protein G6F59_017440 [Rhizopus arrhizus]